MPAHIFLDPLQAYVNDTVDLAGDGLQPSSTLTLHVGGQRITTVSGGGSLSTDPGGNCNFTFVVPAGIGAGPVTVEVNDGASTVDATLTILGPLASLSLSPLQGTAGSAVTAAGNDFRANSAITLQFGSQSIAGCTAGGLTADAAGAFSCTFAVPGLSVGDYTVMASDGQDSDSVPFAVTGARPAPRASAPVPLVSSASSAYRDYGHLGKFQHDSTLGVSQPAWFIVQPGGPTIHLWINPQTYTEQTQSLFVEAPTLGGFVRLSYGEQPVQIVLEGTTGLAGWDAADHGGMDKLQRLKPQDGYGDVQVAFHYPYMFRGPRYCYVDEFIQETTPEAPLFYSYRITLSCYDKVPTESPSFVQVDPSAPSGGQWDCHYSSLNLPWTNPQHPPGFLFRVYVTDKNGNPKPVLDKKGKPKKDARGQPVYQVRKAPLSQAEILDPSTGQVIDPLPDFATFTIFPEGRCTPAPKKVAVTPPHPKPKPPKPKSLDKVDLTNPINRTIPI